MKKTLDSGAELDMTLAPFGVANKLKNVVLKELQSIRFDMGASSIENIFEMEIGTEVIDTLKNILCTVAGSEPIQDALWPCMDRATYKGARITPDTFEAEDARGDYLTVFKEVLWFNLRPFFKNLPSLSKEILKRDSSLPK